MKASVIVSSEITVPYLASSIIPAIAAGRRFLTAESSNVVSFPLPMLYRGAARTQKNAAMRADSMPIIVESMIAERREDIKICIYGPLIFNCTSFPMAIA